MADDDEHEEHPLNPLAFILGQGMTKEQQEEHKRFHERQAMARDEFLTRLHRFLDELNVEQLVILRSLLNTPSKKHLQFVDGQVYSILRVKHDVDPNTGEKAPGPESLLDGLPDHLVEHLAATEKSVMEAVAQPGEEPAEPAVEDDDEQAS